MEDKELESKEKDEAREERIQKYIYLAVVLLSLLGSAAFYFLAGKRSWLGLLLFAWFFGFCLARLFEFVLGVPMHVAGRVGGMFKSYSKTLETDNKAARLFYLVIYLFLGIGSIIYFYHYGK